MATYDLVIKGGRLVVPRVGVIRADVACDGEKIVELAQDVSIRASREVIDAKDKFIFPGAIDSHFHVGIYRPLSEDAATESKSAAAGGVTTILSYFRTGQHYLNKTGPYKQIFPELLALSKDSYVTDYGYHLAIITEEQLEEIEWLVKECGVSTFKYYMFYKLLNLAGSSADALNYLMIDNSLDFGFLYRFMREISKVNTDFSDQRPVRLSIHCENPEIIRVTTEDVRKRSTTNSLRSYSDARPSWEEELAIWEVALIAHKVECPINLLHLSSREAMDAAKEVARRFKELDILLEVTLHHLGLSNEKDLGPLAKVNPPIRSENDRDYLWQNLKAGYVKTVVSDHACITKNLKKGDMWTCLPGFGGTALMFPILVTEGYYKRGLPLQKIAELTSYWPAVYHGLYPKKGSFMIGSDADFTIINLEEERQVKPHLLHSAQDFTPFEGMRLKGWPEYTILRGKTIFAKGELIAKPGTGVYIKRPVSFHYQRH